MIKNNSN